MGVTYTCNKFFSCHRQSFRAPFGEGAAIKGLTHMRSMCVGVAETGVEHCSPAKKHEVTFIFSYLCVTKSTKSQQGGLAPSSFQTTGGVHESVARAMRGKYVRRRIMQKSVVLPLSTISAIPRVRTKCTRKPSRFVHAWSARPL